MVLDVEQVYPIRGGAPARIDSELAPDQSRRPAEAALEIEIPWDDGDQMQILICGQRVDEQVGDLLRPQVLVLEVDQPPGLPDRLGVAAGDGAFAVLGEFVWISASP